MKKIAMATLIGFALMGFIGFFVKLVHIPINNILGMFFAFVFVSAVVSVAWFSASEVFPGSIDPSARARRCTTCVCPCEMAYSLCGRRCRDHHTHYHTRDYTITQE